MSNYAANQTTGPYRPAYRIEAVEGGWEAQMLYSTGIGGREVWQPLNPEGYWCDQDSYEMGDIVIRHTFLTQAEAATALRRAKEINGHED